MARLILLPSVCSAVRFTNKRETDVQASLLESVLENEEGDKTFWTQDGAEYFVNRGCPGNDINEQVTASSAQGCVDICKQQPGCRAVTWNGPGSKYHNNGCNLKTSCQNPGYMQGEWAMVLQLWTEAGADYYVNKGCPGNDIEQQETAFSAQGCVELCKQFPGCNAVTWNGPGSQYHNNVCNMKTSCQNPSDMHGEWAMVLHFWTQDGVSYSKNKGCPGNDINQQETSSSAQGCAELCRQYPGCNAVTWNGPESWYHNNACNMKTSCQNPSDSQGEWAMVLQ